MEPREIKFRAWLIERKKMFTVDSIQMCQPPHEFASSVTITDGEQFYLTVSLESVILLQYIGLKDRQGKGLFVGDIFRFSYSFNPEPHRYWNNFIVFEGCCFGFRPTNPSKRVEDDRGLSLFFDEETQEMFASEEEIEVVGNIYEHKHLLE